MAISIQPEEAIALQFGAKQPGAQMRVVPVEANFNYCRAFGGPTPVAYQTLLLDAMRGDATLFTRGDEIEAEWGIVTPIEQAWQRLPPLQLPNYPAGSEGPRAAEELVGRASHGWRRMATRRAA